MTIDDFPTDRANCATCTQRRSLFCERMRVRSGVRGGYLHGPSGSVTGVIYRCVNYVGRYRV